MFNLNDALIHALKLYTPMGESPVDILSDILPFSKETAYRRLRGEIKFTLEEAVLLSLKLHISLDSLIGLQQDNKVCFHVSSILSNNPIEDYAKMLNEANSAMLDASLDSDSTIYIATNILPIEFSLKYATISKFFIFKWMHQMHFERVGKNMDSMIIPEYILNLEKEVFRQTSEVSRVFVWGRGGFELFIEDLKYFLKLNLINLQEVESIKKELHLLVNDIEQLAITGCFNSGKTVEIYICDILIDSSYHYFETKDVTACGMRQYGIFLLSSDNLAICQNQKTWIKSLIRDSVHISGSGAIERNKFISDQRVKIDSL
ncbi:hypothetical protein AwDysgo_19250 [Bacteroidales bacterium]|nr:hypothetical protein AwDysgo_19250 [Bacteroidales bacterium]